MPKTERELRQDIVDIGQLIYQKGWVAANDGNISVRVDPEAQQESLRWSGPGALTWVLSKRADLLPRSRGGKEAHVYNLCRVLLEDLIRRRLLRAEYAPEGVVEGFSAYLAPDAIRNLYRTFGKALWPVPFDYFREEGPPLVEAWLLEEPETPSKKIAKVLAGVRRVMRDKGLAEAVKAVFHESIPARDVMARLHEVVCAAGKESELAALFTEKMLHPPVVWTVARPDFRDPSTFAGLEARTYRDQVFLAYDRGAAAAFCSLEEDQYLLWVTVPEGRWRLGDVRLFCKAPKALKEARVRMQILDSVLKETAGRRAVCDRPPVKKPRWYSLGGVEGGVLSGPFFFAFSIEPRGDGGLRLGVNRTGGKSHSGLLLPGSHVGAVPGGGDWMVRFYLSPEKPLDRKALDGRVKALRKVLKAAAGGKERGKRRKNRNQKMKTKNKKMN